MRFSGIRPDLSPEDKVVKRELAKCLPLAYSDLCELCFGLVRSSFRKLQGVPNSALAVRFSDIRPDLSSEDKVVKQELAKCLPRAYSELIR